MERFRSDNTEGYTADELARLNVRFADRVADARRAGWDDGSQNWADLLDSLAERVLADYDTEQANGWGFGAIRDGGPREESR